MIQILQVVLSEGYFALPGFSQSEVKDFVRLQTLEAIIPMDKHVCY